MSLHELESVPQRARLLMGVRRHAQALELVTRALAADPQGVELLCLAAECLRELERPAEALSLAEQALAAAPDAGEAHAERTLALLALDRLPAARQACGAWVRVEPEEPRPALVDSVLLSRNGDLEGALASCDRALGLAPGWAALHLQRSELLRALGRGDEADRALGTALSIEPEDAGALTERGWTELRAGRPLEARRLFRQVLAQDPGQARAREGLIASVQGRRGLGRAWTRWWLRAESPDPRQQDGARLQRVRLTILALLGMFYLAVRGAEPWVMLACGGVIAPFFVAFLWRPQVGSTLVHATWWTRPGLRELLTPGHRRATLGLGFVLGTGLVLAVVGVFRVGVEYATWAVPVAALVSATWIEVLHLDRRFWRARFWIVPGFLWLLMAGSVLAGRRPSASDSDLYQATAILCSAGLIALLVPMEE